MCTVMRGRGEGLGHAEIRQIAGEFDTGIGQRGACRPRGSARRARAPRAPSRRDRLDQEFAAVRRCAPRRPNCRSTPDRAAAAISGRGPEHAEIGRLVPGEGLPSPARAGIGVAQHLAKSEHAVEPVEIERGDRLGRAHHAVVRVMEQQQITRRRDLRCAAMRATSAGSFHSCTSTRSAPSSTRSRSSRAGS